MYIRSVLMILIFFQTFLATAQKKKPVITIHYTPGKSIQKFLPDTTFGVAFDGHEKGDNDMILQPQNIKAMLSVGMKPLTYRLRTELGIETWHWNPKGNWSEPKKEQGYWTSSVDTSSFISLSYGYRLPRRGHTVDQANNDGYSRITDGDTNSFWKSNPYLDEYFTKEPNRQHAQWMVIDLGKEKMVNAIKINWGIPYATSYTVDYALEPVYDYFDNAGYFEIDSPKLWKQFPNNTINNLNGKNNVVLLAAKLMKVRFLRIRMTESSHTANGGSTDVRDSLGFAIKEIYIGRIDKNGKLADLVQHSKNNKKQSKTYVSSTDPWHRTLDIDSLTEQVGIDRLYHSGITSKMPVLIPAGLLYDTPENTFALVDYFNKKKYPVAGIELGEEPDGQMISPEDAASLYNQFAKKILQQYPSTSLGGPSLQTIILNQLDEMFPTKQWMERYVHYLQEHNSKKIFDFFSFEWYPFDSVCAPSAPQLAREPDRLGKAINDMKEIDGLKNIPFYITEYGYSAFAGESEVKMQGALMNADIVGQFLTMGGNKAFLYGWEPNDLQSDFGCAPGNNMLFGMNKEGKIRYRTAPFYGAEMMSKYWAQPSDKMLEAFPASSNVLDKYGQQLITAYTLRCPDDTWSLLLINKDPLKSYEINVQIVNEKNNITTLLKFPLQCYQYSGKQYQWKSDGSKGHPIKNLPPEEKILQQGAIILPPYSLTVIRSPPSNSPNGREIASAQTYNSIIHYHN